VWFGVGVAANPLAGLWSKNRRTIIIVLVAIVVLWVWTSSNRAAKTTQVTLPKSYASQGRVVLVHAKRNTGAVPLVVALADDNTLAKDFESNSALSKLADKKKFSLVYAQPVNSAWQVGPTGPDAQYVQDVVNYVSKTYPKVDSSRIYIWGLGEGGRLALALACANPTKFAAVAVVGEFTSPPTPNCGTEVPTTWDKEAAWDATTSTKLWNFSSPNSRHA
jgi:polyhydroxybutyrate depolymerase